MRPLSRSGLEAEPFFEARSAEGMKAIEQGKRLVEELGAYLDGFALVSSCSPGPGRRSPQRLRLVGLDGWTRNSQSTSAPSPGRGRALMDPFRIHVVATTHF